jgi:hypothetical protein
MTKITCPECGNVMCLAAEEDLAARSLTCRQCQKSIGNPIAPAAETSITEHPPLPAMEGPSSAKGGKRYRTRQSRDNRVTKAWILAVACFLLGVFCGPFSPMVPISDFWLWQNARWRVQPGMTLAEVESILGPGTKGPPFLGYRGLMPHWDGKSAFFHDAPVIGEEIYLWGDTSVPVLYSTQIRIGFWNGRVCDMKDIPAGFTGR